MHDLRERVRVFDSERCRRDRHDEGNAPLATRKKAIVRVIYSKRKTAVIVVQVESVAAQRRRRARTAQAMAAAGVPAHVVRSAVGVVA